MFQHLLHNCSELFHPNTTRKLLSVWYPFISELKIVNNKGEEDGIMWEWLWRMIGGGGIY